MAFTVTVPDDMPLALEVTPEQMAEELRLAAAVKLFELGRLSSGAAAELAGLPRCVFLSRLADYDVDTFTQSSRELAEEFANA
jgi:predicted HTH domain antitoxin